MSTNCTDSSNSDYQIYWFNYFVSIGYISNSDIVNLYAPYGKCTTASLWITYLINVVHFFVLSTSILYILHFHRSKSGFLWPFLNWFLSLILIIVSMILFKFRDVNSNVISILTIGFQVAAILILWISILIVILFTFSMIDRYQRCLLYFVLLLFVLQLGPILIQPLITLHCLYNLRFYSLIFDYSSWSAIVAAVGTIISILLFDSMFIWLGDRRGSGRIHPASSIQSRQTRATSPRSNTTLSYSTEKSLTQRHRFHHLLTR